MAYKDDDKETDLVDHYEEFARRGWDTSDEKALIAFATNLRSLTGLSPNDNFEALAELYKDYISPTQEVFYTRKAEVEEELADLALSVRTDKPYERSKDISSRKSLERKISNLKILKNILDHL